MAKKIKKKKKSVRRLKTPEAYIEDWEQQDGEPSKAFFAFATYRDADPRHRSIKKCVKSLYGESPQRHVTLWERWSVRFSWVNRVKAYERYVDRNARKAVEEDHIEVRKRHITMARLLQRKAVEQLNKIESENLTNNEVLSYLKEAIVLERDALGLADSVYDDTLDVTEMSDEELKALIEG